MRIFQPSGPDHADVNYRMQALTYGYQAVLMHTHESPVAEIVALSSLKFDYGTKFKTVAGNLTRFLGFQAANRDYQIATITVTKGKLR